MIFLLICLIIPLIALKIERYLPKLNSVLVCYSFGIIFSLMGVLNISSLETKRVLGASIVLAIIYLTLAADLRVFGKSMRAFLMAFFAMIICVCVSSLILPLAFQVYLMEPAKISAMLAAVYTGSIPNLFVVGNALDADINLVGSLQLADIICSALFSLVLLSPLVKFIYRFLKSDAKNMELVDDKKDEKSIKTYKVFLLGLIIFLSCILLQKTFNFKSNEQLVILSFATAISIMAQLTFKIGNHRTTGKIGDYFLLIFCFCVGSLVNLERIFSLDNIPVFLITFGVIVLSTLMHMAFCRYFKISKEVAIITMTAGIYSPAFIPPVCKNIDCPNATFAGVSCGLLGLALGSYIGMLVYSLFPII